jgi:AraC-like DNA-binding protein
VIFALVAARHGHHLGERREADAESPDGSIAEDLRDLLDARLFDGITLAEAGRILEVSPAHLVRSFRRRFGISPHRSLVGRRIRYLTELRLTRAARLLRSTDATVADVARSVGYGSEETLSRAFKAWFGEAPSILRARRD